jgi:hypothetical protein
MLNMSKEGEANVDTASSIAGDVLQAIADFTEAAAKMEAFMAEVDMANPSLL